MMSGLLGCDEDIPVLYEDVDGILNRLYERHEMLWNVLEGTDLAVHGIQH